MVNFVGYALMFATMGDLVGIVDSLENKVSKLLHKMELLQQLNAKLKNDLEVAREGNDLKEKTLAEWEERYNSLKMANTMLGSNTSKTEAKLKINTLIRELDVCIAKLSD